MKFTIVFAAILSVAVAAPQSLEFLDIVLSVTYNLPDSVRETATNSYLVLINGVAQLAKGVPITVQSVIAGGVYSLASLFDGTLNLQDHVVSGVKGVTLANDSILVGQPHRVESVMAGASPDVGELVFTLALEDFDPWTRLLCFWKNWIHQHTLCIEEITAALNGLSCDNTDTPPAHRTIETSSGTFISIDYLNYFGCYLQDNLKIPNNLFTGIQGGLIDLQCYHHFN